MCVDFLTPSGVCINMCIAVRWFSHEDGLCMLIFDYTCLSKYTLKEIRLSKHVTNMDLFVFFYHNECNFDTVHLELKRPWTRGLLKSKKKKER